MYKNKIIIVVIPAYNVEKQIVSTVSSIPNYVDKIIVVDDCSKDRTAQVVEVLCCQRVLIIKNKKNLGVGGAVIEGLKAGMSINDSSMAYGDIFIKVDGDGQMDPKMMEQLILKIIEGNDYAKGNRFLHHRQLEEMPKLRLVGNFLLTFLTKLASGYWKIFDPQNGYVAIKRNVLEMLPLEKIYKRYFFENDMLINLNIIKAKVADVSMPAQYRDEQSSMKINTIIFSFPWLLIHRFFKRIYLKYVLYDFSVIGFFFFSGVFLMIFGSIFGAYHWILSIISDRLASTGTVMISVLPIILGFQLFLQAIVLELNETIERNG